MAMSLAGYTHVCTYRYESPEGEALFGKQRWELLDPIAGLRAKQFRYWDFRNRTHRKPIGADTYLYRLPEVLGAVRSGETVHWAEGEKDADALAAHGAVATSHHQGAGRVTTEQAAWLRGARRVVLWVDLDRGHWEVGAYDAVLRHNLLVDVGVPARRIRVVRARVGKDAYDHLERHPIERAVPVDKKRLARAARGYTPSSGRRAGYRCA